MSRSKLASLSVRPIRLRSAYNVLVKIGNISLPLLLDSGSSDLWTIADTCKGNCTHGLPIYPHKSFKYSGVDARLFYGDTASMSRPSFRFSSLLLTPNTAGTYAFGPVGKDTVDVAGVAIQNQYFAAISTPCGIPSSLSAHMPV